MSCFCNIFPIGIAKYKGHGDEERICLRLSMIINLLHLFAVNWDILKSVIHTSLPFALEQLCFNGDGIIVSMFVVKLGTSSVAANAVSNSTLYVFYAMGQAVVNLCVTVVGQCIGVWICMGLEWLVRSVIFLLRFRSGVSPESTRPAGISYR